jgi:threonine synthase
MDGDTLFTGSPDDRARRLIGHVLGDELSPAEVAETAAAIDFPLPVRAIGSSAFMLELFHGPTLAFKDVGARFLARVLAIATRRAGDSRVRTILTATSGDTGSAVAHAFFRQSGFRVVVLYPRGRISPVQERQFCTLGENVETFAVEGAFDDCQTLVKACFADAELSRALGLVSANSINIARLLGQVVYYVEAVAQLHAAGESRPPVICVPSGNFGNLSAGLIAQRLGVAVRTFVVATNRNTTVPDYLESGTWRPRASVATLSNAMDVGAPNNWERVLALFGDDLQAVRSALRWGSATDEQTCAAMRDLHAWGVTVDPHTAVAWHVLKQRVGEGECGLFLATAHPAKFLEVVEETLGIRQTIPDSLARALERPILSEVIPNDLELVKRRLQIA